MNGYTLGWPAFLCAPLALGQTPCIPDVNGDGHPRFGMTSIRVSPEYFEGELTSGKSGCAAFGDFDGDGDVDAAVCHGTKSAFVSILINRGDGAWEGGQVVRVGSGAISIATGDLNDDGDLDIVTANELASTVSVLLGTGEGTFHPRTDIPVGQTPYFVGIGRFDANATLDLVVLNFATNDSSILLGAGDGTFAPEERFAIPGALAGKGEGGATPAPTLGIGDLDGDGDSDLVAPVWQGARMFVNDGTGSFTPWPLVAEGLTSTLSMVIADVDGNGWNDIAASSSGLDWKSLKVSLSSGPFALAPAMYYDAGHLLETGGSAKTLDLGDIDGDGDLDALVAHAMGPHAMLLRNDGHGVFGPKEPITIVDGAWFARLVDLNADTAPDIAALSTTSRGLLHSAINRGDGTFAAIARFPRTVESKAPSLEAMVPIDVDNDGDIDLACAGRADGLPHVRIFINDGAGAFDERHDYTLGTVNVKSQSIITAGDLDGDGWMDLVFAPGHFKESVPIQRLMNGGDGTFAAAQSIGLGSGGAYGLALGDLDGDGDLDLIATCRDPYPDSEVLPVRRFIVPFINDGTGALQARPPVELDMLPYPGSSAGLTLVDADLDGNLDVVASTGAKYEDEGYLHYLRGDGLGGLVLHQTLTTWREPRDLALLPGDSRTIGVIHGREPFSKDYSDPYLSIVALAPAMHTVRTFHDGRQVAWANISIADHGGRISIVVLNGYLGTNILLNEDLGGEAIAAYPAGDSTGGVVQGDFNGDGALDVAIARGDDALSILLANPCPACIPDCDEDGDLDTFDYLCFLDRFADRDPRADIEHDGDWDLFDILAFQGLFAHGCE